MNLETFQSGEPIILYIAGWGRSGSTLLARMLSLLPVTVAVGEVRHLWREGILNGQECPCGRPVEDCEFWRKVIQDATELGPPDAERSIARFISQWTRTRNFLGIMARLVLGCLRRNVGNPTQAAWLERTYLAIAVHSKSSMIIDSSKSPLYLILLSNLLQLDIRVIHLIRDPRGAAYSWSKRKYDRGKREFMHRHTTGFSAAMWFVWNGLTDLLGSLILKRGKYVRIRYEDLVSDPDYVITQACHRLDLRLSDPIPAWSPTFTPPPNHMISGNPSRFLTNEMRLLPDNDWAVNQSRTLQWLVATICWPLMVRYGYPLWLGHRRDSGKPE